MWNVHIEFILRSSTILTLDCGLDKSETLLTSLLTLKLQWQRHLRHVFNLIDVEKFQNLKRSLWVFFLTVSLHWAGVLVFIDVLLTCVSVCGFVKVTGPIGVGLVLSCQLKLSGAARGSLNNKLRGCRSLCTPARLWEGRCSYFPRVHRDT